ncbi:MAG: DUF1570 domain-containing protein [Pirellulales bacterium]
MLRIVILFALVLTSGASQLLGAPRDQFTMSVDIDGADVEGMPLAWSNERVYLLGRDGRLWEFPPNGATRFRKTSPSFSSYSAAEMRARLERELGGRLEVTGTGHYLVAHPPGKSALWSNRFEQLYRSCVQYFGLRSLRVHEPAFPLVAIVWPRFEDFQHYAASQGSSVSPGVLGFYSPISNRVMLYDQGAVSAASRVWQENESTIIHEATHQMAFNIGVHNRFTTTPLWVAEGLGTMFEARGVWNWSDFPRQSDRINRPRLMQFRQWQQLGRQSGAFVNLVGSDRQFETNPAAAYAEAWAWVFFLTENYPRQFGEYVQRTAQRPDFEEYPLARRMADFSAVFGDDFRKLEAHFLQFMAGLQ